MNDGRDIGTQRKQGADTGSGRSIARPTLAAFGVVVLLLLAYEVVERTWLAGADLDLIYTLHRVRGASAALVAGALASWLILRRTPPLMVRAPGRPRGGYAAAPDERHLHYARWFVLMRWIAVVVASVLVFAAVETFGLLPRHAGPPLAATVALLALANLLFALHLRQGTAGRRFLALQAYTDIGILIALLHFSGGIENPLTPLTLLHVIIAAIVLDRRHTYLVAGVASGLFALLAWGEWSGVLPHYPLGVFPHPVDPGALAHAAQDSLYVASRVVLQAAMLFLVAFFTTSLTERIRRDERKLEGFATHAYTQAKLLEEALAEQKAAQAELIRAERLAALGQLAGQVAHEVNNPIAILSAKARLLLRENAEAMSPRTRAEITKIVALADRVGHIAGGLLTFCRPAPGEPGPVDIRVPIRTVLSEIGERAEAAGVRIQDDLPRELPLVRANERELEQVFLNIFHNAVDAMPHGGVLRITAAGDSLILDEGAPAVEVAVEDTGTGIPPALQDRIFEPFLTTKTDARGAGLGLSISFGLIRGQGGQIDLESEPGRYTRVLVRLPATLDGPSAGLRRAEREEEQAYV